MAGFDPIAVPNFAQAALGGYQAGQAMGKQKRRDEAIATYGKDPEAGIAALETVDPALAQQLRTNRDAREARLLRAQLFDAQPAQPAQPALGGDAPSYAPMAGSAPAALGGAPVASGASPMLSPEANAYVAPQPAQQAQPAPQAGSGFTLNQDVLRKLYVLDKDGAKTMIDFAASAGKEQQEKFKAHAEMRGQIGGYLLTLPPEQRAQAYQDSLPQMQAGGFIPEAVNGMRFDDASLHRDVALATTTVQAMTQGNADRTFVAGQAQHGIENARGAAGLAVRQGALTLAQKRAAAGGGSPANVGAMDDAALLALAIGGN